MESLKGKLTEEEAIELLNSTFVHWESSRVAIKSTIVFLKKNGYIKQNPVEKAEEMMVDMDDTGFNPCFRDVSMKEIFYNAILYLKKQLEEKHDKKINELP